MKRIYFIAVLMIFAALPLMADDVEPLNICLVSGSEEYESDESLPVFKTYLEKHYHVECTLLQAKGFEELPGLDALKDCDVALFFTRRLRIEGEPLEKVKQYCLSGKPIVAVRTASHGFQNFLEFDKKVLGGNYHGHYGNGPIQTATINPKQKDHPILKGVDTIKSKYSLYKTSPLADDCSVLMTAKIPNKEPEPSAWIRDYKGARVFYTALGGVEDFKNESFRRMIINALYWVSKQEPRKKNG